jgi:hypothetical protein
MAQIGAEIAVAASVSWKRTMLHLTTSMLKPISLQPIRVVEINGGAKSIPVIVFEDGTHLTEPSDNDLKAKLEALAIL